MAIYHFSVQVASRSAGKSAVAMAAYRSGERLQDERTGETKHYARDVQPETAIMAPEGAPDWVYDRNRLWNEVEKAEKRKDSQLCREINVALPIELSPEEQQQLLADYCQAQFVDRGMIADIAIHRDDPGNPHAHIMLTMRDITPDGFGKKNRDWNPSFANQKHTQGFVKRAENLENWREAWAEYANQALAEAGRKERIDHRSFEAQGITDRMPTIHEGPTVREMEARGKETDRGSINRAVKEHNALVVDLQAYARQRQKLKAQPAPKSFKQVDQEWNRLYQERQQVSSRLNQSKHQLQQILQLQLLQNERLVLQKQLEELKPKNLWQRMTRTNEQKVLHVEKELQRLQTRIEVESRGVPPANQQPQIQQEISVLEGTFKALDRAFRALDQDRKQMLQQQQMKKLKELSKAKNMSQGYDYER